jgi:high-affinity iron transporter
MSQALLICFREGLEAFLVIAIATLYLRKANNFGLLSAVRWGLSVSVLGCAVLGVVLSQIGAMSSVWAGVMALVAAAAVTWCVVHMSQAGKGMGKQIANRLDEVSALHGAKAWWSIFAFTVFMVSREGIETATMIASLAANADATDMTWGAVVGVALAGAVSWMWVKFGHKVNLGRFFRVTSWFMMVFAVQLVVYALHEFTEAGVVPGLDNALWHELTEDIAEGWIAQVLSIALVVIPTAWLIGAHLSDQRTLKHRPLV